MISLSRARRGLAPVPTDMADFTAAMAERDRCRAGRVRLFRVVIRGAEEWAWHVCDTETKSKDAAAAADQLGIFLSSLPRGQHACATGMGALFLARELAIAWSGVDRDKVPRVPS